MTKNKQQIQDEIAELQKQLEEMERPKEYNYLVLDGAIARNPIKSMFYIIQRSDDEVPKPYDYDQPHGLGVFETREEAEDCRAALIGVLDLAKGPIRHSILFEIIRKGKSVIKSIEEGTYG